jgi:subtilisin
VMKRTLLISLAVFLILGILFSLSAFSLADVQAAPNNEKVKVFIGFTKTPGASEQALVRAFGGEIEYTYEIVPAIAAELPEQALPGLLRNPTVTIIEPVIEVYLITDPIYQQELDNTWGVKRIGAGSVHSDGRLGSGVKVAIIDSGIDNTHPELAGNYIGGYDFADKDNDPMDKDGHGTHVAGTVAAVRNGSGVVGAAPAAELYALKVFGDDGSGDYSAVIAALDWAVKNGIQVTNNSYGSGDPGSTVKAAFDNAAAAGILHVAAAGNSGLPSGRGDNVGYPARFDSVLAVAASDSSDYRARFSSTGPAVELIAPGVSIRSTIPGGDYASYNGTSMASPHVAGVAALVWAAAPNLSPAGVRAILTDTAQDLGLLATQQGNGLVRADRAVAAATGGGEDPDPVKHTLALVGYPVGAGTVSEGGDYEEGQVVPLTASASEGYRFVNWTEGEQVISVAADFSYTMPNRNVTLQANFEIVTPDPEPDQYVFIDSISYAAPGPHLRVTVALVTDNGSPVSGASVTVNVTSSSGFISTDTGITGSDGKVTFSYRVPAGTYTTAVTAVVAVGLGWDETYPVNSFVKNK